MDRPGMIWWRDQKPIEGFHLLILFIYLSSVCYMYSTWISQTRQGCRTKEEEEDIQIVIKYFQLKGRMFVIEASGEL
jgi:hypothetical protein